MSLGWVAAVYEAAAEPSPEDPAERVADRVGPVVSNAIGEAAIGEVAVWRPPLNRAWDKAQALTGSLGTMPP